MATPMASSLEDGVDFHRQVYWDFVWEDDVDFAWDFVCSFGFRVCFFKSGVVWFILEFYLCRYALPPPLTSVGGVSRIDESLTGGVP